MTDEEYLNLFKINDGKYIIGIYQEGITVYKQQIRALNIFHLLVKTGKIKIGTNVNVAIIGGGVAGLTFAAAALKSNINVAIFEKEARYLHMQHGCDTRKIHPNIYEWPDNGSFFPNARLPVLSWTYDTAANVTNQIVKGFKEIKDDIRQSPHGNAGKILKEYLQCEITAIHETDTTRFSKKFEIEHKHEGSTLSYFCDIIIYAVGYGIEKDLDKPRTPSYWRNDAFGQTILDKNYRNFFISGIGDGGLIDLFRLLIRDYNQDMIFAIIRNPVHYDNLVRELLRIKETRMTTAGLAPGYYYDAFKQMDEDIYKYIFEAIKDKMTGLSVTVHSRVKFAASLDFKRVSLFNAFLAYVLKINSTFTAVHGELVYKDDEEYYYLNEKPLGLINEYIIRHGTDKELVTSSLFLTDEEINTLKDIATRQKASINNAIVTPKWTFGDISAHFRRSSKNPETAVLDNLKHREYLAPDTVSICLGQVSILSRIMNKFHKGSKPFRIALLRVINLDDVLNFQQITPYMGSKAATGNGGLQHVHPISQGLVGMAVKTGKPLRIIRTNDEHFLALKEMIGLTKPYNRDKDPKTFLAIPVLARVKNTNLATNLVLYADSTDKDFFNENEIVDLIVNATEGFIEYIDRLVEGNQIKMCELEFEPLVIAHSALEKCEGNNCIEDLSVNNPKYNPDETALKFKIFHSFDIVYNR